MEALQDMVEELFQVRTVQKLTVAPPMRHVMWQKSSCCRSSDRCEIHLSYAIGVAEPTSIMIETFGTGKLPYDEMLEIVSKNFDLRPAGIIDMLDLRKPIYKQSSSIGHFAEMT